MAFAKPDMIPKDYLVHYLNKGIECLCPISARDEAEARYLFYGKYPRFRITKVKEVVG